jgi:DNA-directed RNA polymerase sigma subunit (sigma70/sigma32)
MSITELITSDFPPENTNGNYNGKDYPALNELVERNLRLVLKFAPKLGRQYGLGRLESISEAHLAIYRAIINYDSEKINQNTGQPFKLSTSIGWWIKGLLHHQYRKIRGDYRSTLRKIRDLKDDFFKVNGREPDIYETTDLMNSDAKPIFTVDKLINSPPNVYNHRVRELFVRMLEQPEDLPFNPIATLTKFAGSNDVDVEYLLHLLRLPNKTTLTHVRD